MVSKQEKMAGAYEIKAIGRIEIMQITKAAIHPATMFMKENKG